MFSERQPTDSLGGEELSSVRGPARARGPEVVAFTLTKLHQHPRILFCPDSKEGVIIDPGSDPQLIADECRRNGVKVQAIWLTHFHTDHCCGIAGIQNDFSVPLFGPGDPRDRATRLGEVRSAKLMGMDASTMSECPAPDYLLFGGEELRFGRFTFEALFTPGHSPGHMAFYDAVSGILIAGDTLFKDSIAIPYVRGADMHIFRATALGLLELPEETRTLAGHRDDSTIGEIRENNPILKRLLDGTLPEKFIADWNR